MLEDKDFLDFCRGKNLGEGTPGYTNITDMQQYLLMLFSFCIAIPSCQVLEIGTHDGTSTLAFLKGVSEVNGLVRSVDIDPCNPAHTLIEKYGLNQWWKFFHFNSRDIFKIFKEEFGKIIDILLIDGDHTKDGALFDLKNYPELVKDSGLILFHDSNMDGPKQALEEFLKENNFYNVILPFSSAMTIMRKTR